MTFRKRADILIPAATVAFSLICSPWVIADAKLSQAGSGDRAPAGQICPDGSFVVGFDSGANIICSGTCGNGILNPDETCDDGNTVSGDGCSADCQGESVETSVIPEDKAEEIPEDKAEETPEAKAEETIAAEPGTSTAAPVPAITDVDPSSVVFGTSEVTITVTGTGFDETSMIVFEGTRYEPEVNATGTQLRITIATADLSIGPYAIKVTNGSGQEVRQKRALVVY